MFSIKIPVQRTHYESYMTSNGLKLSIDELFEVIKINLYS